MTRMLHKISDKKWTYRYVKNTMYVKIPNTNFCIKLYIISNIIKKSRIVLFKTIVLRKRLSYVLTIL